MTKPRFLLSNEAGFTLMEVMISIAIFAVFASVFVTGFGYNLMDSGKFKEDILLKDYCENKINEIISNPPSLTDSLTLSKETKNVDTNSDYQTIVQFKKFKVPEISKILGNEKTDSDEENQTNQMQKKIFSIYKENMEKMLWQVEVTTKNKITGNTFKLSSWIYNQNADVKIGSF